MRSTRVSQFSKLDFRIYWPENFKIRIFVDSIEKIWQKSLVRINFHWPWATGSLLKSMTGITQTLLLEAFSDLADGLTVFFIEI